MSSYSSHSLTHTHTVFVVVVNWNDVVDDKLVVVPTTLVEDSGRGKKGRKGMGDKEICVCKRKREEEREFVCV